jgi:malonyl CoA-acyl carrier protein transacylase/NAD(P)-dependent dehydrogenase (short-subunit alcohol dehydrogenase family)/acyl carrier protein
MVQALQHNVLPATLHAEQPSPHVDWSSNTLALLTHPQPWPRSDRPRRAGVSSFGVSGTNAHLIVEQPPNTAEQPSTPDLKPALVPWLISGKTPQALRAQAARLHTHLLDHPDWTPADVGWSLATTRTSFEHRAVVLGQDRDELLSRLHALAGGHETAGIVRATGPMMSEPGGVVMVFPGQGSQWPAMARELLNTSPVFAAAIAECDQALSPYQHWSLTDLLQGRDTTPSLHRVDVVQPALFAIMTSLARLWAAHGIHPAAVVGHSQGEITAAHIAGALTLDDAARIISLRAQLIHTTLTGRGAMLSIPLSVDNLTPYLHRWTDHLSIAAVNSPTATVISGDTNAVHALHQALSSNNIDARLLSVDYASHSHHTDALRERLLEQLASITPQPSSIPFYSTVTTQPLDTTSLDAEYWYANLRHTVQFSPTIQQLLTNGHHNFIETSPHPVLTHHIHHILDTNQRTGFTAGTLRRNENNTHRFLSSAAELWVHGIPVNWQTQFPHAQHINLPTYAFQHEHYWLQAPPEKATENNLAHHMSSVNGFLEMARRQRADDLAGTLGISDKAQRASLDAVLPALASWLGREHIRSEVDTLRYRVVWRHLQSSTQVLTGRWLVVTPTPTSAAEQEWVRVLPDALAARGARVHRMELARQECHRDSVLERLRGMAGAGDRPAGVVSLLALAEQPHPDHPSVPWGMAGTIALLQALGDLGVESPLWCLTSGAVSTGPSDPVTSPAQALLWGLGQVVADERPELWGGLIDLPARADGSLIARVIGDLSRVDSEKELAVRAAGSFARRLVHAPLDGSPAVRDWRPQGTVLVTDGTSETGRHVARWLAQNGAKHLLLLTCREQSGSRNAELEMELTELGAKATFTDCDISDREEFGRVLASVPQQLPLTAVIHNTTVLNDALISSLTPQHIDQVLRVTVAAALNLHELTRELDLTAFVLFSSTAGTLGKAGQGNYAPANAFLDALAWHRRAQGLPATSVAWGRWVRSGTISDRTLESFTPQLALIALQQALDHDETFLAVFRSNWKLAQTSTQTATPLLKELPEIRAELQSAGSAEVDERSNLVKRLAAASGKEQQQILLKTVRSLVGSVLGHSSTEEIGPDQAFIELGLDSLTSVEFRNRMNSATGLSLPITILFDYPTPAELAQLLHAELVPQPDTNKWSNKDDFSRCGAIATKLESATNEEIIEFIESELGIS